MSGLRPHLNFLDPTRKPDPDYVSVSLAWESKFKELTISSELSTE